MMLTLLECLEAADIGSGNAERIKSIADTYSNLDMNQISEMVYQVKVSRTKDQGTSRLTLALARGPDKGSIIQAMNAIKDFKHKVGMAPAGYLEEELADWVDYLVK